MKTLNFVVTSLVALVLLTTACSPQATPTSAPTVAAPTMAPAATDTTAAAGAMVAVGKDAKLGDFLVDDKGMSLYLYTKDTPNTTVCYDKCATAWPPLLTTGNPVGGTGVDAAKLGTTKRKEGTLQVTYNGWPLYYYAKDKKPGDVVGQDVGSVWYLVTPSGEQVASIEQPTAAPTAAVGGAAKIMVAKNDTLGSFLVDDKGMTLYLYTKDTPNTTVCYDKCATAWPPLLTTGAPVAGDGADDSKLGTTTRKDGSIQVTYNGWPLYYFAKDTKAGDTTGQSVGSVWFVISPDGEQITK